MEGRRASVPFNPAMMQKDDEKDHWLFEKSRPPFGDVFGDRGDYTKGMFYMHRRVYLADDKGQGGAHLRPPEFAMTRKQSKRFLRASDSADSSKIKQINLQFAGLGVNKEDDAVKSRKQTQLKKTLNVKKKQVVYIQKYSSTKPEDWTEEVIAGCRIWTNHASGEVSTECPWASSSSMAFGSGSKDSLSKIEEEEEEEPVYGCGHLVYDSKELDDMFEYLDSAK